MSSSKYWADLKLHGIGRPNKYTPELLQEKAIEYFKWAEENPLKEEKAFASGTITVAKLRAMSVKAFCLFAGIDRQTFINYTKTPGYESFFGISEWITDVIFTQKFEGASADLLNSSIIARDLGLVDKKDITSDGKEIAKTVIKWGDKEITV